jgi:putative transposase
LKKVWADGKYPKHHLNGWLVETKAGSVVEVIGRPAGSVGSVKLPRRGVVERPFAWLGRYRRTSRDDERFTESSEGMIKLSLIHRMLRLLKPDQSKKPVPFKYRKSRENSYRIACKRLSGKKTLEIKAINRSDRLHLMDLG